MKNFRNRSIRKEIFHSSIILSSIILLIFGFFLANVLYHSGMTKAQDIIKQRNYAVNFFVDGYFSEINSVIGILAANKEVQKGPYLSTTAKKRVLDLYKLWTGLSKNITYIYSGYETKEMLINDYDIPDGYDPTIRPWYKAAMNSKPGLSTGLPYHDINDGEWLLSTSKTLFDSAQNYTGVISSDSSIETVINQLKQRGDIYKSSYSFVTKPDGKIIIHHNDFYLNKNMFEIIDNLSKFEQREGQIDYTVNGIAKIAYYSFCDEADWVVVTVVNKNEIIESIIYKITFYLVLIGMLAILLGYGQSVLLSKRFSTPLVQLQKKVQSIINGNSEDDCDYKYPENEIGTISKNIGQVAAHELYVKSKQLRDSNALLEQKNIELEKLSITDQLTDLYNRRKIDVELEHECQRAVRSDHKLSVILFDIDNFKQINDSYGHQAGDSVLQELALLVKSNIRGIDIAGRWGGEEFLIICPDIDLNAVKVQGHRICSLVANHPFSIESPVTISAGVVEFSRKESFNELIKRVDDNLYTAKNSGKNTVVAS